MKRFIALLLVCLLALPLSAFAEGPTPKSDVESGVMQLFVTSDLSGRQSTFNSVPVGSVVTVLVKMGAGIDFADLVCTSSKPSVLQLVGSAEKSFILRALKAGSATVTVKSQKDSSVKVSTKITVYETPKLSSVYFVNEKNLRVSTLSWCIPSTSIGKGATMSSEWLAIEPYELLRNAIFPGRAATQRC